MSERDYPQKAAIVAGPHAWIQWKGTNVCMDIRCQCGELHHLDADFAYTVKTPCGRLFRCESEIVLTPISTVPSDECEPRVAE